MVSDTAPSTRPEPTRAMSKDSSPETLPPTSSVHIPQNSWTDQPPTQSGHTRSRKTKCDGLKPVCTNCIKREFAPGPAYQHLLPETEKYKLANGICLYDIQPKRRGPDRTPGARVRKKARDEPTGQETVPRRRRRNLNDASSGALVESESQHLSSSGHSRPDPTPLSLLVDAANQQQIADAANEGTPIQAPYPPSLPQSSRDDLSSWLTSSSQAPLSSRDSAPALDTSLSSGSSDFVKRHPTHAVPENPARLSSAEDRTTSYGLWDSSAPNPGPIQTDIPHIARSSNPPQPSAASSGSLNFDTEPRISRHRTGSWTQPTSSHFTDSEGYYYDHPRHAEPVSSSEIDNQSYEYLPSAGAFIQ
ncbi:hypothetical protein FRC17_006528 [Serendipita sp. 399]|nr:hypothetical protein FRC17_006528 [Serendipita sp. 399]